MTDIEHLILDNQYAIMMELYSKSEDGSLGNLLLNEQLDKMADLYNGEAKGLISNEWDIKDITLFVIFVIIIFKIIEHLWVS